MRPGIAAAAADAAPRASHHPGHALGSRAMFRDKSLIPAEAVRLVALGLLADEPRRYGDLALAITHFNRHVVGTSLDLMGASLEALRYEGLVEAVDGQGMTDNAVLRI